jgi:glycosyltransferase involved in cell wall biosynthesis
VKISVIAPILNEVQFVGYSIMSCLEQVHEFIYSVDSESSDGTRELLEHIKNKYAHEKLRIIEYPHFETTDTKAYNGSFQVCLDSMRGEIAYFLHPDQIVTNPEEIPNINTSPLALWTTLTSYAGDLTHVISEGRCDRWKNMHKNLLGLHYAGAYGSTNEDFYHSYITGKSYKFHGTNFNQYPFEVRDSGIKANHYCEVKPHQRRLEKMIRCLKG